MIKRIFSIRGATTADGDTPEKIKESTLELISRIVAENDLKNKAFNVVNVTVSTTADITAAYPAKFIRESGLIDAPLFSCLEPPVDGALKSCIRVMLTVASAHWKNVSPKHAYLRGGAALRPDLTAGETAGKTFGGGAADKPTAENVKKKGDAAK